MNLQNPTQVLPEPAYLRRNESGKYATPAGQFNSVTTYLDRFDKPYLRNWYAKVVAQAALELFERFQDGHLDLTEYAAKMADWQTLMRAPEAIRDRAGHRGSLTHHAIYAAALLDETWPTDAELLDWLTAEGRGLGLLDRVKKDGSVELASAMQYAELAEESLPFVRSALAWIGIWQPRWETLGLEAYVVNETYEYAGTMDSMAWLSLNIPQGQEKSKTADALRALRAECNRMMAESGTESPSWYDPTTNSILVQIDFKTSKAIRDTFALQIEAYSRAQYIVLMSPEELPEYEKVTLEGRQAYKVPMMEVAASAILHIRPEGEEADSTGTHLYAFSKSDGAWHALVSLIDLVRWSENPDRPARVKHVKPPEPPKRTTVQAFPGAPASTPATPATPATSGAI